MLPAVTKRHWMFICAARWLNKIADLPVIEGDYQLTTEKLYQLILSSHDLVTSKLWLRDSIGRRDKTQSKDKERST